MSTPLQTIIAQYIVLHGSQPLVKSPKSATFLVLLQGAAWNSDLKGDAVMTRTGRYMHFLIMQPSWDASLTSEDMINLNIWHWG